MDDPLIGQTINSWFVKSNGKKDKYNHKTYVCVCSCGVEKEKPKSKIFRSKCCNTCSRKRRQKALTHGACQAHADPMLYSTYMIRYGMIRRCNDERPKNKKNYKDRNITVCDRWLESFENFLEDMGIRPANTTLDRIDNNKGYYKENCRWATIKQQNNNKRFNVAHEYQGENLTVSQWADKFNITRVKAEYWINYKGIEFLIQNIEKIRQINYHTTNKIFDEFGFERRGSWKKIHGAFSVDDNSLKKTYKSWEYLKSHPSGYLGWKNFCDFLVDMGKKPENAQLRRRDTTKQFSKENCFWQEM